MSADEKIVAAYEAAVAAGAVRVGERAPGRLAVLVVALDLGLTSPVPVTEARVAPIPDKGDLKRAVVAQAAIDKLSAA